MFIPRFSIFTIEFVVKLGIKDVQNVQTEIGNEVDFTISTTIDFDYLCR